MEYIKDGKPVKFKFGEIVKTIIPDDKSIACRKCSFPFYILEDHAKDLHGYGLRCPNCGDHQWLGKTDKTKRKNTSHKSKHYNSGKKFCYLCQLDEDELKLIGQHLTVDHIQELQNSGEDVFENTIMICNSCHYLKNAVSHKTNAIRKLLK